MEDIKWKRDETPYIIFSCSKCEQYMYVKESQKTKKCLRCGRSHTVSNIKTKGEIVKGMGMAIQTVKRRQEDLAIKQLGKTPEFRTSDDFKLIRKENKKLYSSIMKMKESEEMLRFKELLIELSHQYRSFPLYIIEIVGEDHGFTNSEIKLLIRRLQKEGYLTRSKNDYSFYIQS